MGNGTYKQHVVFVFAFRLGVSTSIRRLGDPTRPWVNSTHSAAWVSRFIAWTFAKRAISRLVGARMEGWFVCLVRNAYRLIGARETQNVQQLKQDQIG